MMVRMPRLETASWIGAEQYGGRVTFYVVGNRVNSYKSEIQRMYANGHEIGNHTQDHKYLQKLGAQRFVSRWRPAIRRLPRSQARHRKQSVFRAVEKQHCACQ